MTRVCLIILIGGFFNGCSGFKKYADEKVAELKKTAMAYADKKLADAKKFAVDYADAKVNKRNAKEIAGVDGYLEKVFREADEDTIKELDKNEDGKITFDDFDENKNGFLEMVEAKMISIAVAKELARQVVAGKKTPKEAANEGKGVAIGLGILLLLAAAAGGLAKLRGKNKTAKDVKSGDVK